jgi:molecular chaperone GrpE
MEKKDLNTDPQTEEQEEEVIKILSEDDQLDIANKKADQFKDMAQRIQAEFDNYRKRNNESVRQSRNDGVNEILLELLPIIDNFERGLDTLEDKAKSGVELIYKQVCGLLKKYDVEEISAIGEEFNPELHHAIAQAEDAENANKVVEVFQKGYKRKNKVLRPAMVKVAQ